MSLEERRRDKRYETDELLTVYDRTTDLPLGVLANLSPRGAMLITRGPVKDSARFRCRIPFGQEIMGQREFIFDAECRWCRKNIKTGQWESGYRLTISGIDRELVQYLILSFKLSSEGVEEIPEARTVNLENRRESARHEFDRFLPVYEPDSYRQIGELADLSLRGARIFTRKQMARGDWLTCRVGLPQQVFQREYLRFEAECMWSARKQRDCGFEAGFRITGISSRDNAILAYLLIHHGRVQQAQRSLKVVQ